MKDKEKQIEEMTLSQAIAHAKEVAETREDLCKECRGEHLQLANWLIELQELRKNKPPKDSVVLSRGEFEKLKDLDESYNHLEKTKDELLSEKSKLALQLAQARKETANKFLNMIYWKAVKHIKGKDKADCFVEISFEKLDEIAKQFGVDIKE